ncbi:MAG TPA: helix-turn-helix domain-containing GNAT family N-acetyltransferase [Devosia sp.]|jgi:DNA-binding MarR family transcriptional regulator/ribosomal protein S18 acetylase RimI-like enzyme|uniref:bifunctional helix-turn-helix transcriptional regulator/GNAT family N-acetyltransferase n=1 Tax=Devosia sp. TaxID=1871048 RepID=UPI002DDCB98E|nr:helix-turn-helix domain-containing GNAT family N-acetyltransferase [Devosia sp.]HEV2513650.1 helix-turn-helix domain-containing GNAT family N-acetyltransferase [Devosia sp.]
MSFIMDDQHIAEIRRFNRAFARWLGLFDEHYSRTDYSPAESRLFYELAAAGHTNGANLARSMGVDPAYLSRMLQKFVAEGLVAVSPSVSDRRRNQLALTAEGDKAAADVEAAADRAIADLISPLSETERHELVSAMQTIARILDGEDQAASIILRPPRVGDVAHVVARQSQIYAGEFGWDGSYEALAAEIGGKFLAEFDPTTDNCWIAERDGKVIGSVFVVDAGQGVAQLRLLYVEPEARGLGVGKLLVDQVVHFARDKRYAKIRLWTQASLVAARKLYAAAGFTLTESKPHHSFGKDLVGEYWELKL